MKNLLLILGAFVLGSSVEATTLDKNTMVSSVFGYNNSVIFVENGITFSVYPDGEFDFYIDNRVNFGANINFRRSNITFNTGFDYSPFVQYDDFGAVIQIENVPVYYDFYGRVSQIGGINIWYNNGRLRRVGGLRVYYNNRGMFHRFNGFVNVYNRYYVYSPFHDFFARPALGFCLVYNRPYRRFYNPIRYTWYRPYINNTRRFYARVGRDYRYHYRPERERLYRNDRRVVARENRGRRDNGYIRDNGQFRNSDRAMRSNRSTPVARTNKRSDGYRSGRTDKARVNERVGNRSSSYARGNEKARVNERNGSRSSSFARGSEKARLSNRTDGRSSGITRSKAPSKMKSSSARSADYRKDGRSVSRSVTARKEVRKPSDSRTVRKSTSVASRSKGNSRTTVSRKTVSSRSGKDMKARSASRTATTRSRRVQ
ncbi:hypothetical protein [Muriicola marianensis]|uniref:Sperm nuclear basic protein PL-I n=1 Tax=Muriicola marianensis TaxID=1324801 RepID=A0ABQ1QNL5_9FLAO|nr:hypothetical protein [Muriicola marianensis]GGD38023.1 hypothetical protein GCM10011361_01450 [Muriicola marianensis]